MKIAEVSEHYGLSSDTLRYYERIGLIPPVTRNESGIRDYGELDIRRVEFVKCMRSAGLPIEVLIDYMELVQQGDQTIEARQRNPERAAGTAGGQDGRNAKNAGHPGSQN